MDNASYIISIISLCISIASFLIGYFVVPIKEKRLRAETEFFRLFRELIDDYSKYQALASFNGTPLTEAKRLKVKILANCELLALSVKRNKRYENTLEVLGCIATFIETVNDDNYNALVNSCKSYIELF